MRDRRLFSNPALGYASRMETLLFLALASLAALGVVWYRRRPGLKGVAHVKDGDSLVVDGYQVRLAGIDAPEFNQAMRCGEELVPVGRQATQALKALVGGKPVACRVLQVDRYGRLLAVVFNHEGKDLAKEMVRQGMALAYGFQTQRQARRYRWVQRHAKRRRAGMWSADQVVHPQQWRAANRSAKG